MNEELKLDGVDGIVLRIRHQILGCREAERRLQAALSALTGPDAPEEPKKIEARVVEEQRTEPKPTRKISGLSSAVRTAVAKLGQPTTREVTDWLNKHGFPKCSSSTASTMLWAMRKRGECTKDEAMRWHYTGGA